MQDLSILGPFVAVGAVLIAVALVNAHQTARSARRLDKLMAERPVRSGQFYGGAAIPSINAKASDAGATAHHPAPT
jgi:hypothetical protein